MPIFGPLCICQRHPGHLTFLIKLGKFSNVETFQCDFCYFFRIACTENAILHCCLLSLLLFDYSSTAFVKLDALCSILITSVDALCYETISVNVCLRSINQLTLSPPIPRSLYTLPYWSNPLFLIFDIRALSRSGLSARVPE